MIQFIFFHENTYLKYLIQFISNNDITWRYLPDWQEFLLINAKKTIKKNLSFLIVKEHNPIAFCPLFLENVVNNNQFSVKNSYLSTPLFASTLQTKEKKEIERTCFEKIDELVQTHNVSKIMFEIDPLLQKESFNYLIKYHYLDSSINTNIVDLNTDIQELWKKLRKSYRSIINNNQNKYIIFIMDSANANKEIHEIYRELHHKAAGKITRLLSTFDIEFRMLQKNNATLICLMKDDIYIAMSYFYHNGKTVYYGSSADDPLLSNNIPYEHSIIWSAIEYFKKNNYSKLELGWQHFSQQIFDHPSKKEVDISFFKRGFGGNVVPLFRGIKYLNKEQMASEFNNNIHSLQKQFK